MSETFLVQAISVGKASWTEFDTELHDRLSLKALAAEVVLLIWWVAYQDLVLSDLNPGLVMELSKMGLSCISVFPDGDPAVCKRYRDMYDSKSEAQFSRYELNHVL